MPLGNPRIVIAKPQAITMNQQVFPPIWGFKIDVVILNVKWLINEEHPTMCQIVTKISTGGHSREHTVSLLTGLTVSQGGPTFINKYSCDKSLLGKITNSEILLRSS